MGFALKPRDIDLNLRVLLRQGNDPGYMWAMTVLGFWLKLVIGVLGACLTVLWLLQVLLYIFISPPLSPFLNELFVRLDRVFPLFGTFAFALFCFYLIGKTPLHCHQQSRLCTNAAEALYLRQAPI